MNKIIAAFIVIIATMVAHAGYWMPAGRHHDVHFVEDTPRHNIVGANVLGIGFDITVPGRRAREVVSVAPVQGAVTVQAPASCSYVPANGKIVTTVYPNGMTVTEAPVAPAPVVVAPARPVVIAPPPRRPVHYRPAPPPRRPAPHRGGRGRR